MNKTLLAHIALLAAMLIYGASFSLIKEVSPVHMGALGFVLLRVTGATPLFWLSGFFIRKEKVEKKDFARLILLSFCGVAINQSLFMQGMSLTSPIHGAIIMITSPLLVLLIGNVILKERITLQRSIGIAIGLSGAALLAFNRNLGNNHGTSVTGDCFIFINAISWGFYLVLVKPLMKKYHTITILKWIFLFGWILVLPQGIFELRGVQWNTFDSKVWFDVLFIVFGITYVAYLLNTYALKALSPTIVSAYIYLQPVFAASIAIYKGLDELSWQKVISAGLIFIGVSLAGSSKTVKKV